MVYMCRSAVVRFACGLSTPRFLCNSPSVLLNITPEVPISSLCRVTLCPHFPRYSMSSVCCTSALLICLSGRVSGQYFISIIFILYGWYFLRWVLLFLFRSFVTIIASGLVLCVCFLMVF